MQLSEKVIAYLTEAYDPDAVIIYGSYADGSANENSDFDALVITDGIGKHDSSLIDGTELDVFIYPADTFRTEYDPEEFVQIFDGKIVLDKHGIAARLKKRVIEYIESMPKKTDVEILRALKWCDKMLSRTAREDAEGFYRRYWLLIDSLEIYCDIRRIHYFGPKKALKQMEYSDKEAFSLYSRALKGPDRDRLSEWIDCLNRLFAASQIE